MRLKNINGRLVTKSVEKYSIKWSGKSRSKLQYKVKQFFKTYWENHVVYEEFPVFGTLLKVDFINATKRISVEVNGKQHEDFNKFFHDNRIGFLNSLTRDSRKYDWLKLNNFKIIEINEDEVDKLCREFFVEKFGMDIV